MFEHQFSSTDVHRIARAANGEIKAAAAGEAARGAEGALSGLQFALRPKNRPYCSAASGARPERASIVEETMQYAPYIRELINAAGLIIDLAGVLVILIGAAIATLLFLARLSDPGSSFRLYRKNVGRSILLGLELLVGGDIIRTVSVEHPGLLDVVVLGVIVMIRIAMSWAMEVELEGRWPWLAASLDAGTRTGRDSHQG